MAETRLFNSLTAEALCKAGRFVVYGFTLEPFCLLHSRQLDDLANPIWTGTGDIEAADLIIAAQICSQTEPLIDLGQVDPSAFDTASEADTWNQYLRVCGGRPEMKQASAPSGTPLTSPTEMLVVAYLIQHTTLTAHEVWRMPYGMAFWYFESVKEQRTGEAMILTEREQAEIERLMREEVVAERRVKEQQARWIIENIKDSRERNHWLTELENGPLPEGWRASINT